MVRVKNNSVSGTRCFGVALLAVALLVVAPTIGFAGVPVDCSGQSPPGCNANRLAVNISQDKLLIDNGDVVNFTITVINPGPGSGSACDVVDLDVVFHCPAADGTPTGALATLETLGYYPADVPLNQCFSSGSVPADGCIHNAGLACTINVNPGVLEAVVQVDAGDTTPPINEDTSLGELCASTPVGMSRTKQGSVTINQPPPSAEFCRTPGFWGTHAAVDSEKACSQDITGAALTAAGGSISICGATICNTALDDSGSAVEALCVRVQGKTIRQLARQLTAARLNCIVSGESGGACNGISIDEVFDACDTACIGEEVSAEVDGHTINCIDALDCFNNGGAFDVANGICATGTCSDNGAPCTGEDLSQCIDPKAECQPLESNCHDEPFPETFPLPNNALDASNPCFEKQGPAGSSDECKSANKSPCTVLDSSSCANVGTCSP